MNQTTPPAIDRVVPVGEIPAEGRHYKFAASAAECRALRDEFDIPDVLAVSADLVVRHVGRSGFHVTGTVAAKVVQTCVVSLEPFEQDYEEPVDVKLATQAEIDAIEKRRPKLDEDDDTPTEDLPDAYDGLTLDLGAIVAEHAALGLDLYPRKPGVEFVAPADETPPERPPSPFAALARLKKDD